MSAGNARGGDPGAPRHGCPRADLRVAKPRVIGDDFESAVEATLSELARHNDGDWIENVSRTVGEATNAKSGDFDYHLGEGPVIAIEARNRGAAVTLGGKTGVLEELCKIRPTGS